MPAENSRVYYPHKLNPVVKEWIERTYPALLKGHVKALVVFTDEYSGVNPKAICTCGAVVEGDISALLSGRAMNRHIAAEIADLIEREERIKKERAEAFRRDWVRRRNQQRKRYGQWEGKVRGSSVY